MLTTVFLYIFDNVIQNSIRIFPKSSYEYLTAKYIKGGCLWQKIYEKHQKCFICMRTKVNLNSTSISSRWTIHTIYTETLYFSVWCTVFFPVIGTIMLTSTISFFVFNTLLRSIILFSIITFGLLKNTNFLTLIRSHKKRLWR